MTSIQPLAKFTSTATTPDAGPAEFGFVVPGPTLKTVNGTFSQALAAARSLVDPQRSWAVAIVDAGTGAFNLGWAELAYTDGAVRKQDVKVLNLDQDGVKQTFERTAPSLQAFVGVNRIATFDKDGVGRVQTIYTPG